jgi:biuret amidohydrolase
MAVELAELVDPAVTAVVTSEVQNAVVGERSSVPALAEAARPVLPTIGRLVRAARAADVQVVHGVVHRRADARGTNRNSRLFALARKSPVQLLPGSPAVDVVPEVGVEPDDLVATRVHGLNPMAGDLDPVLRHLGVATIVVVGVSVNVAVTGLVMDAVNRGYQVVLPRDAVCGVPADYADAVVEHSLSLLATVTTVDDVIAVWEKVR